MAYENVTFSTLSKKRTQNVRDKIFDMWADGYTANEISKKVKVSPRSVAATMANLTRNHLGATKTK